MIYRKSYMCKKKPSEMSNTCFHQMVNDTQPKQHGKALVKNQYHPRVKSEFHRSKMCLISASISFFRFKIEMFGILFILKEAFSRAISVRCCMHLFTNHLERKSHNIEINFDIELSVYTLTVRLCEWKQNRVVNNNGWIAIII